MEDLFIKNSTGENISFSGAVYTTENGDFVTDSVKVAHYFEKNHKDVLDSIREKLVAENSAAKSWFAESTYENRGKQYPMYLMNQNGFTFLVMGFTGRKADEIKIGYINEFERMRKQQNFAQIDYFSPEFVTGALQAIQHYQLENKELKDKIEKDAPATELGYTYIGDEVLTDLANVAREARDSRVTRKAIIAMLLEKEMIEKGAKGYELRYKKGHSYVDSLFAQKNSTHNGMAFTSVLATNKGKGWILSEMNKQFEWK